LTDQVASRPDEVNCNTTKNLIDLMMYHGDNPQLLNHEENIHESLSKA